MVNTDDIKIEENPNTGGYCCDFQVNNKKFYADVSRVMFCGPECMIFKYNDDDKIDWSGIYTNRNVEVTKESLMQCIKEFIEEEYWL